MNQRDKETLMNVVIGGTLKEVENAFQDSNRLYLFDNSYFDYKLLQAGLARSHQGIQNFLINKIGCRAGNPNSTAKPEATPLHLAMKLDNEQIIKKLLSKGAFIFSKDKNGEIPLLVGFKNENRIAVNALLTHSKPDYESDEENSMLHFHIACAANHIAAAAYFLKCGANPNQPLTLDSSEYSGLNPVQLTVLKDYYELFKKLIRHGGDLSVKNNKGLTPLHIIYYNSSAEERTSRIKEIFAIENNTKFINAIDSNKVSHLHLACMLDNVELIQEYIDNGANVNSSISSNSKINPGYTPLHFAVLNGCEKVVQLLLKNGANCNKKDKEGKTPLHLASKISWFAGKVFIIKILFNFKADPAITDKQGYTPLHMEFYYGNSENKCIFDMLFSKLSENAKNFTNNEGLSHFHIACATNNVKQVIGFLEAGVKVDSCVSSGIFNGYSALHFAAAYNHKDIVELLLENNALVNIKTNELQITPLHLACEFNYTKFCTDLKLDTVDSKTFSVNLNSTLNRTNQLDIVNLLLSHGALVDAKDHDGNVPLIHACIIEKNYCEPKWCYDSHGYLSRLEREGLIKEIKFRLQEIIEMFLCHQGNIVAYSNNQESVLHILCKYKSLKILVTTIKLILSNGTNIDAVDNAGLTALHVAIAFGNNRMARMLLKLKANVNIKSNDSKIPLHIFFKSVLSENDLFCALLECGSDVNIPIDENNKTLLHVAVEMTHDETIKQLLRYGADINLEDSFGNTCMSFFSNWTDGNNDIMSRWLDYDFAETFQILYIHVQKLLALGLYVSNTVQKYCRQYYPRHKAYLNDHENDDFVINLDNIYLDCTKELEKMKLKKIDNYTSLYSILHKDSHEISKQIRNKTLIETMKDRDLTEDFPLYSYLLKLKFRRGQIRSDLLKSAETSLRNVIGISLPILCLDLIIKYSKNEDIVNLKAAALLKRPLKRKLNDNSCTSKSSRKLQKRGNNLRE